MYKLKTIIVVCLFALSLSCKKTNTTPPLTNTTPALTTGMGGMRNWHGHHYYEGGGMHFPAPVLQDWSLPDTSFAIIVVNDSTVSCMSNTFKYESTDSVKQVRFFGQGKYYYLYGPGVGTGIAYYYAHDSIVYFKNEDKHGTTDSWILDDRYYTD